MKKENQIYITTNWNGGRTRAFSIEKKVKKYFKNLGLTFIKTKNGFFIYAKSKTELESGKYYSYIKTTIIQSKKNSE